jgi:hypothetical protein
MKYNPISKNHKGREKSLQMDKVRNSWTEFSTSHIFVIVDKFYHSDHIVLSRGQKKTPPSGGGENQAAAIWVFLL